MKNAYLLGSMQIFLSVVESGSFSESARRLGLSQPSISRQVNKLEKELGTRLLQRTTRSISLTEAGRIYYDKAREIQNSLNETHQAISRLSDTPSGTLRISVPYTWMELKIAPHISDFLAQYPEISLDIQCSDTRHDMVSDQLDIVIRVGRATDSSYIAIPLAQVSMCLVASTSYLEVHPKLNTPSDIYHHNFISFTGCDTLTYTQEGQPLEIKVNSTLITNSVHSIIQFVKQGIGISLLPSPLIQDELKSGELVHLLAQDTIDLKSLSVDQAFAMYPSRKQMPAKVRAFLNFFKDRF